MQSPQQEDMRLVRILVVERGDSLIALGVRVQEVRIVLSVLEFLHDPSHSEQSCARVHAEGGRGKGSGG